MTNERLEHHVLWHSELLASSEYGRLARHQDGHRLHGIVVLPLEGVPCHINYEVVVDRGWSPLVADVTVTTPSRVDHLDMKSDGTGRWELGGTVAPHLDGCRDIDLGWTPATNTVPIRRLDLTVGETATITAAWVRFPELDVVCNEQHYMRLAEDRWQYRSGDFNFELVTDVASGLVVAYGDDLWRAAATAIS